MYRIALMAAAALACLAARADEKQPDNAPIVIQSEEESAKVGSEEQLKGLEWMIGDWEDRTDESVVATSVAWAKNKRFLLCTFKVSVPGVEDLEGTQVIGWDPEAGAIRSWIFDSDGGFGEGHWTHKGNRWIVKSSMVLADGVKAAATNVYTKIDDNTYLWQSIGRQVGDEFLQNTEEVKVVRKPANDAKPAATQNAAEPKPATNEASVESEKPTADSQPATNDKPAEKDKPTENDNPAEKDKPAENNKEEAR
jgi:hypothetical protein